MIKYIVSQIANDSGITVTECTQQTKNLLKENNKPYTLKDGVEGPLTKVVFSEHFISVMREADSTECMAKMSKLEKYLYWDYINYQGIVNTLMLTNPTWTSTQINEAAKTAYEAAKNYIAPELVVRTLSDWAYAEVLQFDKSSCYDTLYDWKL